MNHNPEFPDTDWIAVQRVGGSSDDRNAALSELYAAYFYPLYAWARQKGLNQQAAEDVTQDFIVGLMNGGWEKAKPERGRLRSFLMVSISHFIADRIRGERTQRRGGKVERVPLDFHWAESRYGAEPADHRTPEEAFDRRWALLAWEAVLGELEARQKEKRKGEEFATLRQFLTPWVPVRESYAEIAARTGVKSSTVSQQVARIRGKFRDLMRRHIADTLSNPTEQDIMREWEARQAVLLRPRGSVTQ